MEILGLVNLPPATIMTLFRTFTLTRISILVLAVTIVNHTFQYIEKLFASVPEACPQVSELTIDIEFKPELTAWASLNYIVMKPIVTRLPLAIFNVIHHLPLELSQEDVVEIARALGPTIEHLFLNEHPRCRAVGATDPNGNA